MQAVALTKKTFTAVGMFRTDAQLPIKFRSCSVRHPDAGRLRAAARSLANQASRALRTVSQYRKQFGTGAFL